MLHKQYCEHFGRPAKEPEMMFKLLFLKKLYDLSDEILISSAQTDMAYKYFLDLEPEAKMIAPSLLTKFRKTRITEDILEAGLDEEIIYTKNLLRALEKGIADCGNQKIQEIAKKMKELLENEQIREIRSKDDKDARFGHKTAASTFYGYKNHIAMTEERLIAGISVTHGGAPDDPELPGLIEKAQKNGIKVTEVIGDMAYVSDDNLETCGEEIALIARTNTAVAAAANGRLEEGFCFNKDAGMLQCPAGELAMCVEKRAAQNGNTYLRYVFSKVKCRKCPLRENCHVGKSTSKVRSYSITQVSQKNQERLEFESSEMFRERLKIRHRIEEKNGSFSVSF